MKRETRITILKDLYQESAGISDDDLYDEAIATLEEYFSALAPEVLYRRSRIEVIAYLALINERERSIPVRRGKWIYRDTDGKCRPWWEKYKCSVCGENTYNTNYCPHCGAKMDEEES